MEHIIPPILQNDRGSTVYNLQDALGLLVNVASPTTPEAERLQILEKLAAEQRNGIYGKATAEAVIQFERDHRAEFNLEESSGNQINERIASAMNTLLEKLGMFGVNDLSDFIITGSVEFEDGTPARGMRVSAFDRDIGENRVQLGDPNLPGTTAENGFFPAIRYKAQDFEKGEGREGRSANLVFVISDDDHQTPMEVSAIYRRFSRFKQIGEIKVPDLILGFEATPVEEVRIVLVGRPGERQFGEYKKLLNDLEPLLINETTPANFDQEKFRDVDFSSAETGWDRHLIEAMQLSWQLAGQASREPQSIAETFYGLLRDGAPTEVASLEANLPELLDQDTRWESKLKDSLDHNIIDGELSEHIGRLRNLRTLKSVQPGDGRRASMGDILGFAGIAESDSTALVGLYHEQGPSIDTFWSEVVPQRLSWSSTQIAQVQSAIQLADLVSNDLPLLAQLHQRGYKEPKDLVKMSRSDWTELVKEVGVLPDETGDTIDSKVSLTVDSITAVVSATYPTETMARIALHSQDSHLSAARDLLSRFFEKETTRDDEERFDIRTSPVTTYLETHAERVFDGIQANEQKLLKSQLQRLQRAFRLSADSDQAEKLMELKLDSAFHVTRFSPEHFATEYGEKLGGYDRAILVYGRAEQVTGTMLYLFTNLWDGVNNAQPRVMKPSSAADKRPALKELPEYKDLFGSLDMCDCCECQSFFSPAAYFVDQMHMLDVPPVATNPLEFLLRRRPDLAFIQLTCENTNTLIPYVDLVTEILESFIANRSAVAFNIPPPPPNQKLPAPSAEELRVNPVYLTSASSSFADQAYATLQEAVFPLNLPLNLPLETTRVYLEHLGTSRSELMLWLNLDPSLTTEMAKAAEILQLSPEEFEIISHSKFSGASSLRPKTTEELFGLSMGPTPTTLFNHAAPEFALIAGSPDKRKTLIRSLQNILYIISPPTGPVFESSGVYDNATEKSVNAYLTSKGLPPIGKTDAGFWGAMDADGMPSLSVLLCPVSFFLDRTELTYVELVALVKTRFVNPELQGEGDLDYLTRVGIPAADVRNWIVAGLPATIPLAILTQIVATGEDPDEFTSWVKRRVKAVVINTGFETPCDLDRATLMHLDGTLLLPDELMKLFTFIRLWRKTGWSFAEMDNVLEPDSLASAEIFTTILLMANIKQLRDETQAPIEQLISLWASIPTFGAPALYDRLFRNRAAQLVDPVFELNRDRTELKAATATTPPAITDFADALLAAFKISAQDLTLLRAVIGLEDNLGLPPAARPKLTINTLSAIYRQVSFAQITGLSIRESLSLIDLSGLNVFERPNNFSQGNAVQFFQLLKKIRSSEMDMSQLDYICREVPQPPGLPGAQRNAWRKTLAKIIDGIAAIDAQKPIEDDPIGEALTASLTELFGQEDARTITALVYGSDVYFASLTGFPVPFTFPPSIAGRISYDAAQKQLKFKGAMASADFALLSGLTVPLTIQPAFLAAIKAINAQPRVFVARALKRIFTPADAEAMLIDISSLDAIGQPLLSVIHDKREQVVARNQKLLSRSMIKQELTTATSLPDDVTELLLENEIVLKALSGTGTAIQAFQNPDGDGLDAEYFSSTVLTLPPVVKQVDGSIAFDWLVNPLPPGVPAAGFSVKWTGSLYVPATGEVTFYVHCTDGVRVTIAGQKVIDEWKTQPEVQYDATIKLDGGEFYEIEVSYFNSTGNALVALSWNSPSISPAVLPKPLLYSRARLEELLQNVERIYKCALLLTPLHVTANDLAGLARRKDIDLNVMPINGPAPLPIAQAMFAQWLLMRDFAALRNKFASSEISLIDVLNEPSAEDAKNLFFTLSGVAVNDIDAIVEGFTIPVFDPLTITWSQEAPDLTKISWWYRISKAIDFTQTTGAAPGQLFAWANAQEFTQTPSGPEIVWFTWTGTDEIGADRHTQNAGLAQTAKNIVRARYSEDRWRAVGASLNDMLRIRRRSGLTAFLIAMPEMMEANVTNSNRLFEFLLIDVEMDPCMKTSRILQGTLSIQHFVNRVLLNLESPNVSALRIDRNRWEWMKNYRVWEANRKVLIDPAFYTEEALRDDKTPNFIDFESQVLQDELTEPNVERAFRRLIENLDDMAKFIVCGTCIDNDKNSLHVFGRSSTSATVFYHRELTRKNGYSWTEGIWSPWKKVPVDVATIDDGNDSGAHLLPVVWNRRLYLFWPIFEQKVDDSIVLPEGFDRPNCWRIKLAWSEYKDGIWSPKQIGSPFLVSHPYSTDPMPVRSLIPRPYHPNQEWQHGQYIQVEDITGHVWARYETPGRWVTIPQPIDQNDTMLGGIVLKEGDWAQHDTLTTVISSVSLLAKPGDHFLDIQVSGSSLSIRLWCRYGGVPKGQTRTIVEDTAVLMKDGQRTDRKEKSQEDIPATGPGISFFKLVGVFTFPACTSELQAVASNTPLSYNSLKRPGNTTNSFMTLRRERSALGKAVAPMNLADGQNPILRKVLAPFNLIDSDNLSGFNRMSPFFFQDQRRCYLVIREAVVDDLFKGKNITKPDLSRSFGERITEVAAGSRSLSMAADSSIKTNPWAINAVERWSEGPAIPVAERREHPSDFIPASPEVGKKPVVDKAIDFADWAGNGVYVFIPHWHPYTCPFIAALNKGGMPALFTLDNESLTDKKYFIVAAGGGFTKKETENFSTVYEPDPKLVSTPYPAEKVDFSLNGSYSKYNWEIFFHAPMALAEAYRKERKFAAAMRCYHYILDPMTNDPDMTNHRVWRFRPFRDQDNIIKVEETVALLSYTGTDPVKLKQKAILQVAVQEWMAHPFNPHAIARVRTDVYMKYTFHKYIDNLIDWADDLFARDTMESINEATELYVLVANLLGPKPQKAPAPGVVKPKTYQEMRGKLNELSDAIFDLESRLPFTQLFGPVTGMPGLLSKLPQQLYFCVPQSDKMLAYWDTIADRLFKIRHCMSIDGTVRQLPLFDPPIDPMLLVEAVAHGIDIGSVINDLYAPLSRYRFAFTFQRALSFCNEVRAFGNSLLSLIEKGETEMVTALRTEQETALLDQVKANKKLQMDEAEELLQALENTSQMVNGRIEYYDNLIAQGLISEEKDQLLSLDRSNEWQEMASWIEATAQSLNMIPNVSTGQNNSATFGGSNLGSAVSSVGRSFSSMASSFSYLSSRSSITGGQSRRMEEWRFQRDLAKRELKQVMRQKAAAAIRKQIAEADLRNHELQLEHSRTIGEVLRNKFTNKDRYNLMESRLRPIYFQCYQAAYKAAKHAERCAVYERGIEANFIKYGSWDSSIRGLLAGEQLYLQLKQMEQAFLDQQVREFEIIKRVSLLQLNPLALIELKESGKCEFEIPEWLYDMDYPGHYFRRIQSISVTVPTIIGPYGSLSATLTLLSSKVRESAQFTGSYSDDENYRFDHLAVEAIAVSTGQNDVGRFQLDFRDEKYLPFEGSGAISKWRIELPSKFRSIDYDHMSDIILDIRLKSRKSEMLVNPALADLEAGLNAAGGGTGMLFRFFSLSHEFPNEWHKLMSSVTHEADFTILKERFPLLVQGGKVSVKEIHSAMILKEPRPALGYKADLTFGTAAAVNLQWPAQSGRYRRATQVAAVNFPVTSDPLKSVWQLKINSPTVLNDIEALKDILIVFKYSVVF
ncbi:MAG: neuraminidase-like domain-containing protein [Ginsengibacter sp.]